jgi:ABC-2 type transport system ATP-binding protein
VTHWYGNVVAVNDITLELGPGVTGLLGPNGAGKSTILHLLSGFLSPSRGSVTIAGEHRGGTRTSSARSASCRSATRSTRS